MALEAGCLDATSVKIQAEELALKVQGLVRDRRVVPAFKGAAGPLEVDLVEGQLRWRGEKLSVPHQVLIMAAALVAHAGRPVANPTLLQELGRDPWSKPQLLHKTAWRLRPCAGVAQKPSGKSSTPNERRPIRRTSAK
jgi:DNA-binding response OmpR family regulator